MVIDYYFLEDLGVGDIDQATADDAIAKIQAMYMVRLGLAVGDKLSDDELDEFEKMNDQPDKFIPWLQERVPDYSDIADDIFFSLKAELTKNHKEFLGI